MHIVNDEFICEQVEETLRSMYEGLQKFAVGLEQIVLDQAVYGGNYHQHFHEAEFQLKYVSDQTIFILIIIASLPTFQPAHQLSRVIKSSLSSCSMIPLYRDIVLLHF